jgi:Arc/MetJ-type ribon-helix-helix transcriptional regulator
VNKKKQETKVIATRVTQQYAQLIEEFILSEAYLNCADLVRDALREKLERDAREMCKHFFGTAQS